MHETASSSLLVQTLALTGNEKTQLDSDVTSNPDVITEPWLDKYLDEKNYIVTPSDTSIAVIHIIPAGQRRTGLMFFRCPASATSQVWQRSPDPDRSIRDGDPHLRANWRPCADERSR